ncbi:hypothetical protein ACNSOL_00305 [Aliarcobacter lanthieri]|uniref:hypothetical protein n=1 Tax=Aliarcobacter lanthieri TaxID=1355374 RepID=UPI003AABB1FE
MKTIKAIISISIFGAILGINLQADDNLWKLSNKCIKSTIDKYPYPLHKSCQTQINYIQNMEKKHKECRDSKYFYLDLFKIYSDPFMACETNKEKFKPNYKKAVKYLEEYPFKSQKEYYFLGELYGWGHGTGKMYDYKVEKNIDKSLKYFLEAYNKINVLAFSTYKSLWGYYEAGIVSYLGILNYMKGNLEEAHKYFYLDKIQGEKGEWHISIEARKLYKELCFNNQNLCNKKPKLFSDDLLSHNEAIKYFKEGKTLKCYSTIEKFDIVTKDKKWLFSPNANELSYDFPSINSINNKFVFEELDKNGKNFRANIKEPSSCKLSSY